MALVTLSKTWVADTRVVQVPFAFSTTTDHFQLIYLIKTAFVAAGWVVMSSSDSISTGVYPLDYWTSYTSVVCATPGSVHSWVVLRNTAISPTFDVCLDCRTTNATSVNVFCSYDGYKADGTISNKPTVNTSGVEHAFTTSVFYPHASGDMGFVFFYSTDGSCFRLFCTDNGTHAGYWTNNCNHCGPYFIFDIPKNSPSWLVRKYVAAASLGYSSHSFDYSSFALTTDTSMRTSIGTTEVLLGLGGVGLANNIGSPLSPAAVRTADSGGSYTLVPPYLVSLTSSYPGILGTLHDCYLASCHLPEGSYIPTTGLTRGLYKVGAGCWGSDGGYLGLP